MEKHAAESYFVIGEGLLTESAGGRNGTVATAALAGAPPFRFSRMGPKGINRQLGEPNRTKVGNEMAAGGGGRRRFRPVSPTSVSSSTRTSPSTRRT